MLKKPRKGSRKPAKAKSARRGAARRPTQPGRRRGASGFVTWEAIRRAFGNLIVMADNSTHAASRVNKFEFIKKILDNKTDTREIFFLLASFVFDLHLRMVYIVEALSHVGPADADAAFTQRVTDELRRINGDPKLPVKDWESTAKDAFAVMMAAHGRIHAQRQKVVFDALR